MDTQHSSRAEQSRITSLDPLAVLSLLTAELPAPMLPGLAVSGTALRGALRGGAGRNAAARNARARNARARLVLPAGGAGSAGRGWRWRCRDVGRTAGRRRARGPAARGGGAAARRGPQVPA